MMPVWVMMEDMMVKSMMAAITSSVMASFRLVTKVVGMFSTPLKAQHTSRPSNIASAILRFRTRYHTMTKAMNTRNATMPIPSSTVGHSFTT